MPHKGNRIELTKNLYVTAEKPHLFFDRETLSPILVSKKTLTLCQI
jgi:hypothetical protein